MSMFWSSKNPDCVETIQAVARLTGVDPSAGMWNTFNEMQEAGWLDGTTSIGDVQVRWLSWLIMDTGKLRARQS